VIDIATDTQIFHAKRTGQESRYSCSKMAIIVRYWLIVIVSRLLALHRLSVHVRIYPHSISIVM